MKKMHVVTVLKNLRAYFAARDLSMLVILLVLIAGTWGFLQIVDEFREGDSHALDVAVLQFLRTDEDPATPKGPGWFLLFMRDITTLGSGSVILLVTLIIVGYMLLVRRFSHAVLMAIISGGGAGLVYILKLFFARERPSEVPQLIEVALYSFPSGHAMMAALVYLSLAAMLAGIQSNLKVRAYILIVAFVVVFLIGLSRIYLGVHYPTDVLAGWSVGLAWAAFSRLAVTIVQNHVFPR